MKHEPNDNVRLLVIGVLATTLLAGCPWDGPETHLARGKELAAKEKHGEAVIEFKNFLQTNPKSVEVRYLLGRELLAQNNPKASEIELQKAYDGKYQRDLVVPLLAICFLELGEHQKLAAEIGKGDLSSPPANAQLRSIYGWSLMTQGKPDEALAAFRAAQQEVPGFAYAMIGEAKIRMGRGDVDGASAEVNEVLAKDAGDVEALVVKGDLARLRGDLPAAIVAYQDASTRAPRNLNARLDLSGAYFATKQFDLAQKEVTALKRMAPGHPDVNYQDALLAFNAKDFTRAADAVRLTLNEMPGSGAAEILSGAIAIANNQPEQAELHLQEGLRQLPRSLYARKLLTRVYLNRRDARKAEEALRPGIIAFPNDPDVVALAGQVALQAGNFAEASRLLARAKELDPGNASVQTDSARAEFGKGDEVQGFAVLESAAKASTNNPLPRTSLVLAHLQRGQFSQALEAWKPLAAERPDDPVVYNLRAAIAMGQKDYPEARKALERALQIQPDYFTAVSNLAALDEMAGDIPAARGRYTTLIAKDKNNVVALLALAKLEAKHGAEPSVVIALLNDARKPNPAAQEPTLALAAYHVSRNNIQDALSVAQEGYSRSPNNLNYLVLIADLQFKLGNVDQSIAAYRKVVTERPKIVEYQVGLGRALLAANQFDAATEVFVTALKANPADIGPQVGAVATLLGAARLDQANRLIGEIRKANPKSPALVELDGDSRFAAKQYAEAAAAYRKVNAQSPTGRVTIKLYTALQQGGGTQAANALLADWMKAHPDDSVVRSFDAGMAVRAGDYPRAAEGYRTILRTQPNDAATLNNLAWTLWLQKDPTALATAEKANAIAPNDPMVNDTLGWILVEQGPARKGIELLQKAATAAPGQRDIALHLAKAQIKDGRKDEARTTLQNVVRNAPGSPEARESKSLIATIGG